MGDRGKMYLMAKKIVHQHAKEDNVWSFLIEVAKQAGDAVKRQLAAKEYVQGENRIEGRRRLQELRLQADIERTRKAKEIPTPKVDLKEGQHMSYSYRKMTDEKGRVWEEANMEIVDIPTYEESQLHRISNLKRGDSAGVSYLRSGRK